MPLPQRSSLGFTLLELIFVIVIIGELSVVAIPYYDHLTDNAKISAEIATASSVQTEIDNCHGEWIVNSSDFVCGASISRSDLNSHGYPDDLGAHLDKIIKHGSASDWSEDGTNHYKGPASDATHGTNHCIEHKPCIGRHWDYNATTGNFTLVND